MTDDDGADAVRATTTVPASPGRAFAVFTEELETWWPAEFTWSQDVLERIGMDARKDGLCFERGPHGFTINWGRVLRFEPPQRIVFSWQISPASVPEPNPAKASQVDVRFSDRGGATTQVELLHSGFDRHGDGSQGYRAAMADQGWPHLLERYTAAFG